MFAPLVLRTAAIVASRTDGKSAGRRAVPADRDRHSSEAAPRSAPLVSVNQPPRTASALYDVPLHTPGYGGAPEHPGRPVAGPVQAKLRVGAVDDPLEQEADRAADAVMRLPIPVSTSSLAPARISRNSLGQRAIQRGAAPTSVHQALSTPGVPLEAPLRRDMEERFGHDFSQARVHSDALAQQSAREVGALAYTVGQDVVFGAGEFAPSTPRGRRTLAHELAHVVQQSASGAGGRIVQRQPKAHPPTPTPQRPPPKTRDPAAEVQHILTGNAPARNLKAWLDAHPADLPVAERVLLEKATTATAEKEWKDLGDLLGEVFARDPNSQPARTTLIGQVGAKADDVWAQYTEGALMGAIKQWAADPHERARIVAKTTVPAEKTDRTKQLASLGSAAANVLSNLRKDRGPLMRDLERSLSALPLRKSRTFDPRREQDLVTSRLRYIESTIASAENFRARTYELYTSAHPERSVAAEIATRDSERGAAQAGLEAANRELDEVKKLTGARAAASARAAKEKVRKAQGRLSAATVARTKATPAAARAIKYKEDVAEKKRVDAALAERSASNRILLETRAKTAKLAWPGGLVDDDAIWWIMWHYTTSVREGFEGFPMEHVIRPFLLARNKLITAPRSTGIDAPTSLDTYAGHGWGQYDLDVPAGTRVDVVEPREIDLSSVFGGKSAIFEWVGSRVETVFGQDPRQTEKDALDKLGYGFFGRDRQFEKKIEETDVDTSGLPKGRGPEPNRLVAGLLYRGTVVGAPLEIEDRLVELRNDLEQLLEDSSEFQGLRVDDSQDILRQTFDASRGAYGTRDLLNRDAFVTAGATGNIPAKVIQAFDKAVKRILQDEDSDFTKAVFALMQDRLAALRASGGVEAGHKGVLDWAGPSVYVLHHYRLKGGPQEAWIRVIYLHLRQADAKPGEESRGPLTVGKSGSGGAAISPHVHMSIAVFRTKPSWNASPVDYIDPTDFFGMVPRSPFNPAISGGP
jgi:Domain of unknown function (DUF4157)